MAAILFKGQVRYAQWPTCSDRSQELVDVPDVTGLKVRKDGLVHQAFFLHDPARPRSRLRHRPVVGFVLEASGASGGHRWTVQLRVHAQLERSHEGGVP